MNKHLPLSALLALTLTACGGPSAQDAANEAAAANAAAVAAAEQAAAEAAPMPPAIKEQKVYRCADGDVLYIDFLQGDTQATLRVGERNAVPTALTAAAAGEAFTAEGISISGAGDTIDVTRPGKPSQSCKA